MYFDKLYMVPATSGRFRPHFIWRKSWKSRKISIFQNLINRPESAGTMIFVRKCVLWAQKNTFAPIFDPISQFVPFFRNFKKCIDFSPKKHRGKNEIGRFWLVKCSKQYHNYVGRSNILSCFLSYNDGCMAHLLHIHIRPFVFCQIHKNNPQMAFSLI